MVVEQPELKAVTKTKNGKRAEFAFDFDAWTEGDMEDWQEAAQAGDLPGVRQFLPKCVKSTPYGIDCNDPDAYRTLPLKDFRKLQQEVGKALQSFLSED
jgi:hypothetical protein